MTSKVPQTLNAIASHPEFISDIRKSDSEYYFHYKTYLFSIADTSHASADEETFVFYVYPKSFGKLSSVVHAFEHGDAESIDRIEKVEFRSKDYPPEPFKAVYRAAEARFYKLDHMFDDIISDDAVSSS